MTLQAAAPTFGGNSAHIEIGRSRYGIPPGWISRRLHGDHKRAEAVYVLEPGGSLHLLTEAGEIPIPARLVGPLVRRYFPESSSRPS